VDDAGDLGHEGSSRAEASAFEVVSTVPCPVCGTPCAKGHAEEAAALEQQRLNDALFEGSRLPREARVLSILEGSGCGIEIDPGNVGVVNRLRRWVQGGCSSSLYLYGQPGTGKTLLTMAASMDAIRQGLSVIFLTEEHLINMAQLGRAQNDGRLERERAKQVRVLVIDDLGQFRINDAVVNELFAILNARCPAWGPMRPVLVTGNLDPGQLSARYSEAIASRLMGLCGGEYFQLVGRDRRRKG